MRYLDVGTEKRISKIGLGTWQFGSPEWGYGEPYADREAEAIVRRALDLGVTLFDTAEIYSSGRSERILGRALGRSRESAFVATKVWPIVPSARVTRQRAEASARRLTASCLDLYQVHWPNPLIDDRAIMRGMRRMRRSGLVGEVGVSSYSLDRWRAAEDALSGRVLSNQVAYSLMVRSPEADLIPFAESSGRVIIAFSPLAHGLLSGRYHRVNRPLNRVRTGSPLFGPEGLERTTELIATLREVASAHDATAAQIALAWAIRSPAVTAIPGASSIGQLESNVAAADIELADDEYQALTAASDQFRPDTVADVPGRRRFRHGLSALKHTAVGGWFLSKTIGHDYRLAHFRRGVRQGAPV